MIRSLGLSSLPNSFGCIAWCEHSSAATTGANARYKLWSSIALLRWNKALWLVVPSHMTFFNQPECIISTYHIDATLKFVYDIGFFCEQSTYVSCQHFSLCYLHVHRYSMYWMQVLPTYNFPMITLLPTYLCANWVKVRTIIWWPFPSVISLMVQQLIEYFLVG